MENVFKIQEVQVPRPFCLLSGLHHWEWESETLSRESPVSGPLSLSLKQLRKFQCFANSYHCFIKNYSQRALNLTALTSVKKTFLWTSEAEGTFKEPRENLPVLPSWPNQIHPSVLPLGWMLQIMVWGLFFLKKLKRITNYMLVLLFFNRLCPAEHIYDVGDWEMLEKRSLSSRSGTTVWREQHTPVIWTWARLGLIFNPGVLCPRPAHFKNHKKRKGLVFFLHMCILPSKTILKNLNLQHI